MTKRSLFVTAACLLFAQGVSLRAQEDAPPTPPTQPAPAIAPTRPAPARRASPLVAAPNASTPAPGVASAPGAYVAPPLAPLAALAPAPPSGSFAPDTPMPPLPALAASAPLPPQQPDVSVFFTGDNFLGVRVEEITRENVGRYNLSGEPRGVGVREVLKGSPAERAGLREMDVIVRFDGEAVTSVRKLNRLIDESAPEHPARLTVRRGGSEQELTVSLGKRELGGLLNDGEWRGRVEPLNKNGELLRSQGDRMRKQMEEWRRDNKNNPGGFFALGFGWGRRIGVSTNSLGKQLADYFGVPHGVLVTGVEDDSPASRAGLKAGDIITDADGENVDEAGDLSRALNRKEEGEVSLTVVRDRKQRTVRVTPEKRKGNGIELMPGSLTIEAPTVAVTTPGVHIALPKITVAPRVNIYPRAKVTAPGRIL